jgi:hypothetical protein
MEQHSFKARAPFVQIMLLAKNFREEAYTLDLNKLPYRERNDKISFEACEENTSFSLPFPRSENFISIS